MPDDKKTRRACDVREREGFFYSLVRLLLTFIVGSGAIRLEVRGHTNVPASGPVLLLANHQSNLDPLLIAWSIARPITIPAKVELFGVPLLGPLLWRLGAFPVDRKRADATSLRRSVEMLRQGRVLAAFPEGGRTRSGDVGPFRPTLTRLAIQQQVPIVPVGLAGTARILRPGSSIPRLGSKVSICFGSPFELGSYYGRKPTAYEVETGTKLVRDRVIGLVDKAEASSGVRTSKVDG